MTEHTPGPWTTCAVDLWGTADAPVVVQAGEWGDDCEPVEVAEVCGQDNLAERDANVRLVAASPDLLAACQAVLQWAEMMLDASAANLPGVNQRATLKGAAATVRAMVVDAVAKAIEGEVD